MGHALRQRWGVGLVAGLVACGAFGIAPVQANRCRSSFRKSPR